MTAEYERQIDRFLTDNAGRIQNQLADFLRLPSISTQPAHDGDVAHTAEWLASAMREAGSTVEVHPPGGHPIVLGCWTARSRDAPTVLVYGHYDVQPAEPLEPWDSPPFEPTVRDGRIHARGATDDKGQLFLHVKALEAMVKTMGAPPLNVLLLAEGEEEIGSVHLAPFLEQHRERLRCDAIVVSDSALFAPGAPSLLCSLRGIAYFQLDVAGPEHDLHSGDFGGAISNPANALARILASLHDDEGRIDIPGFYDDLRDWPIALREAFAALPFDETAFRRHAGVTVLAGEQDCTTLERLWLRPSCDIHGLRAGYMGEGAKTVLPASASAKLSFRLVADQDPLRIDRLLRDHVTRLTPPGVEVAIRLLNGSPAWRGEVAGPVVEAAKIALRTTFERDPVVIGDGASIPVVVDFERILGVTPLLLGFGLPGENAHGPNECFDLGNFELGMRTAARLWNELSRRLDPSQ
jgi:acetylornithine deacetylase/succinyl-diaminopimelate desuccinylase-like protein